MDIGGPLFDSLDSPIRTVRKVARAIVIFLFLVMPITFWHLFTGYVHEQTVKAQHLMTQVELPIIEQYYPTVTTVPSRSRP